MTFEEFDVKLPDGICGGMMRAQRLGQWTVKFWRKFHGAPPGIIADDFIFILRGLEGESAESVFIRALPVALAAAVALKP